MNLCAPLAERTNSPHLAEEDLWVGEGEASQLAAGLDLAGVWVGIRLGGVFEGILKVISRSKN